MHYELNQFFVTLNIKSTKKHIRTKLNILNILFDITKRSIYNKTPRLSFLIDTLKVEK